MLGELCRDPVDQSVLEAASLITDPRLGPLASFLRAVFNAGDQGSKREFTVAANG